MALPPSVEPAANGRRPAHRMRAELLQSIQKRLAKRRTRSDRLTDALVTRAGTFTFILVHVALFGLWIFANSGFLSGIRAFDPYPFNFLTMAVSLEAIFLSLFVLISQNRDSKIADLRQEFDVQVNMIAEREITKIINLLAYLMNHLNVPYAEDAELRRMMRPLDIDEIREELEQQLDLPNGNGKPKAG